MSLRWYSGFDFLATSQLASIGLVGGCAVTTPGRASANQLQGNAMSPSAVTLPATQTTLIAGLALKTPGYSFAGSVPICAFYKTGVGNYVTLTTTSGGYLEVSGPGGVLGTGTTQIPLNSWVYLEIKAAFHSSTGSVTVRLNSVSEITVPSGNTGSACDTFYLGGGGSFNGWLAAYDDIYLCDSQGSAPYNDFLGDVSCQVMFPTGAGNSTAMSRGGVDSGANWSQCEETSPNDDTDYVYSASVGTKDLYAFGDLSATSGTIYAVQPRVYARKDDAGARSIASVVRLSGGTEEDSADRSLGETYAYYSDIRTAKPGGGTWSIADVNDAQFGAKVTV